jgi:RNA polymerase subunit RPABC4/transcription elongation factor Spt4
VPFEIGNSSAKKCRVITEVPDCSVAAPAQQSANFAGLVVVINSKPRRFTRATNHASFRFAADSAESALCFVKGGVFIWAEAIFGEAILTMVLGVAVEVGISPAPRMGASHHAGPFVLARVTPSRFTVTDSTSIKGAAGLEDVAVLAGHRLAWSLSPFGLVRTAFHRMRRSVTAIMASSVPRRLALLQSLRWAILRLDGGLLAASAMAVAVGNRCIMGVH